jgi:membrane protein DedA with SNARE-associated domain
VLTVPLVFAIALHIHHQFHGPPIDYATLAVACFASWVGVPGPGEPVLVAAGILAADGRLSIGSVLAVAWVAATAGGIAGWLLGRMAGRAVITAPGPLRNFRIGAVERGEEVFRRYTVLAIVVAPTWIAGIHRVRTGVYMIVNAASAALWAVGIGLGAYFVGPPIVDAAADFGWLTLGIFIALVASGVWLGLRRRRVRAE